jgi:ribosomal protein L35AE/L33A
VFNLNKPWCSNDREHARKYLGPVATAALGTAFLHQKTRQEVLARPHGHAGAARDEFRRNFGVDIQLGEGGRLRAQKYLHHIVKVNCGTKEKGDGT